MITYIAITAFTALLFLLYRQGFAVSKRIRAVLFVFRMRNQKDLVSLNSCTGQVRHRICIRHTQAYEFSLDCQLPQGEAEILKKQDRLPKQPVLCWRHLSSRAVASQVLWAETSLTTVFGMGTGGPSF